MRKVIDALVSKGAAVDAADLMGRTALHHAAKSGDVEACRRVLSHGEGWGRDALVLSVPISSMYFCPMAVDVVVV